MGCRNSSLSELHKKPEKKKKKKKKKKKLRSYKIGIKINDYWCFIKKKKKKKKNEISILLKTYPWSNFKTEQNIKKWLNKSRARHLADKFLSKIFTLYCLSNIIFTTALTRRKIMLKNILQTSWFTYINLKIKSENLTTFNCTC